MFKRLNQPESYGAGSGAGLAFVKKVVENNNGRILLQSVPGQGSTFYFSFASVAEKPAAKMVPSGPKMRHV